MEKSDRLGGQEYFSLLVITTVSIVFFTTPRRFFIIGGNAAWISASMATLVAFMCVIVVGLLLKKHPGKGLLELNKQIIGGFLGTTVNVLFVIYFLFVGALVARLLAEAIVMTALPELPLSVVVFFTVLLALYGSLQGWNVLAKASWTALPFLAIGVLIPIVLTTGRWNTDYLFPLLGLGFKPTILGGAAAAGVFGDVLLTAILARTVQNEVQPFRVGGMVVIVSGVLLVITVLATSVVFPYPVASHLTLPYYMLSRALSFGRFLQRMEALTLILWSIAALLKISIGINAGIYIFADIFSIRDHKPLLVPYGAIVFTVAMMPSSFLAATDFVWIVFHIIGGSVSLLLPALIAVIGLIRLKPAAKTGGNA